MEEIKLDTMYRLLNQFIVSFHIYWNNNTIYQMTSMFLDIKNSSFIILLLIFCYGYYTFIYKPEKLVQVLRNQGVHILPRNFPFGQAPEFLKYVLGDVRILLNKWDDEFGEIYVMYFGPFPFLSLVGPKPLYDVLYGSHKNFPISDTITKIGQNITGGITLVGTDGDPHTQLRRILRPAFDGSLLKNLGDKSGRKLYKILDNWEKIAIKDNERNCTFDKNVTHEFQHIFATINASFIFGYKDDVDDILFIDRLVSMAAQLRPSIVFSLLPFSDFLYQAFRHKSYNIIKDTRREATVICQRNIKDIHTKNNYVDKDGMDQVVSNDIKPKTILDSLASAVSIESMEKRKIQMFSSKEIVTQATGIFISSHLAISSAAAFALYALAKEQKWQEMCRNEIYSKFDKNKILAVDDIKQIPLLQMIIYETLRMYPSALSTRRVCAETTTINNGKLTIPKGITVCTRFGVLFTKQKYWKDDVHTFNPLRFVNGMDEATIEKKIFMPFGGGRKRCIGKDVAMIEIQITLAIILQRFNVQLKDGFDLKVHAPGVAMPERDIWLTFTPLK